MEAKPFYLSKTLWVQLLGILAVVLAAKVPAVSDFIKNYFTELGSGWLVLNTILRIVSKDKLSIS